MDTSPISSRSMVSTKRRVFRLSPSCYAVSSLVATLCLSSSVLAAPSVQGEWVGERASESLKKFRLRNKILIQCSCNSVSLR